MDEEFTLTLKGFKSKAQVKAFMDWYEGQGERHGNNREWIKRIKKVQNKRKRTRNKITVNKEIREELE